MGVDACERGCLRTKHPHRAKAAGGCAGAGNQTLVLYWSSKPSSLSLQPSPPFTSEEGPDGRLELRLALNLLCHSGE